MFTLKRISISLWSDNIDPLQILKDLLVENNFRSQIHTIKHGLFKDLILETDSWSRGDLVSIISGNYEREVLEWIQETGPFETIVNVGAGTGYYPLGLIKANFAKNAILFEINPDSLDIARNNAGRNGIESICTFLGGASEKEILDIEIKENSLVIIDIEGGEFKLLTDLVLDKPKTSFLIVEIHDFTKSQKNEYVELLKRTSITHASELIEQSERNPHTIPEILHLNENSRWMLMSEGRPGPMSWLCLSPLK